MPPKKTSKKQKDAASKSTTSNESSGLKLNFTPRSAIQKNILQLINKKEIVFLTGATGTGKTFLATVAGLRLLLNRRSKINKLVIVRPAVTAQEDIGFLPGNSDEKLSNYVMPVYEHIIKLVGEDIFHQLHEKKKKIEVIPIGFLRGRNFENSFVIFDEAQNANIDQFKLVITRIAENSKIVICGDPEQCDIHEHISGLIDAIPRFSGDPDFGTVTLPISEIQRHPLVSRILSKYNNPDADIIQPDGEVPVFTDGEVLDFIEELNPLAD